MATNPLPAVSGHLPTGLRRLLTSELAATLEQLEKLEAVDAEQAEVLARAAIGSVRAAIADGAALGELTDERPQVFAAAAWAASHTLGQRPHPNQILAGLALAEGSIVELATGEGKTLAATMPAIWLACAGEGMHIATANDYLARRDADWMGPIYHLLGFTVGVALQGLEHPARRSAYTADITYGTATNFGFDYLRDHLVDSTDDFAQREPFAVIVDEADSLLIDEARTPLIVSSTDAGSGDVWFRYAKLLDELDPDEHFEVDLIKRTAVLTESGVAAVEEALELGNLYDHPAEIHHVHAALDARALHTLDEQYLVGNVAPLEGGDPVPSVVIIDEHTGRPQPQRRYADGLHEAIEAKEGLLPRGGSVTVASVALQSLFNRYTLLSGMTGTVGNSGDELERTYGCPIPRVPTHEPCVRIDHPDRLYQTLEAKLAGVVEEIIERHAKGQPLLIGCPSVAESDLVSQALHEAGVEHSVLNARRPDAEAVVVAQAGRLGAVTVATNMAGRGVDIKLGGNPQAMAAITAGLLVAGEASDRLDIAPEAAEGIIDLESLTPEVRARYDAALAEAQASCARERDAVLAAGGLCVLGTSRHSARRIDDQLRGRSARQGEPGESQFVLSCEDELIVSVSAERFAGSLASMAKKSRPGGYGESVSSKTVVKLVKKAQEYIEAIHSAERESALGYYTVEDIQRDAYYKWRDEMLTKSADEIVEALVIPVLEDVFAAVPNEDLNLVHGPDLDEVFVGLPQSIVTGVAKSLLRAQKDAKPCWPSVAYDRALNEVRADTKDRFANIPDEVRDRLTRDVLIGNFDNMWRTHLEELALLRSGIGFRGIVTSNPQSEYGRDATIIFDYALDHARRITLDTLCKMQVELTAA